MNHLNQIAAQLPKYGLDAMLITSEPGEFYAIGFRGEGTVIVTAKGNYYFTASRYIGAVESLNLPAEVTMVGNGRGHMALTAEVLSRCGIRKVGIEEQYLTVASFQAMTKQFPDTVELVPAGQLLTTLRAAKDEEEQAAMKEAQHITDQAFVRILNDIKPGVKECEIAAKLTYYQMLLGAEKNSFDPIVASGPNGSMPHVVPGQKEIQEGEFVTMDFGCIYHGYCSDMTRTVCVGQPTEEMKTVYYTVLEAQEAAIAMNRAGVPGCDVHNTAIAVLEKAGYGDKMGHGFGHSLGIEIHEEPRASAANREPLPLNCMISEEPGIYLPGKFGVRIEDVVLLKEDHCIDITHAPKRELIIL